VPPVWHDHEPELSIPFISEVTNTGQVANHRAQIFVESWSADYGSPMQIDADNEANGSAQLIDEEGFGFVAPSEQEPFPIAFIDGVRRQEAALSQWYDGRSVSGIAGAYAVGTVLAHPGKTPIYSHELVERLVIWSSGLSGALPVISSGWHWREVSTPDTSPIAPIHRLQDMMRRAEARLADSIAQEGYVVVMDGTLWFASAYDKRNIAGYIKTHHVRLLPEVEASRLPELPPGYRTTIFRTVPDRYACYLRLAPYSPYHSPMTGIVRLEFSGSLPLDEVREMANRFASALPPYAGVAHADPRAPQNLQPIGALETRLRHLLGDPALAERAVRDAVAALRTADQKE